MEKKKIALLARTEIPAELTWDLTKIFATDAAFETEVHLITTMAGAMKQYRQTMQKDADALVSVLETLLNLKRRIEKVYVYASLKNDEDTNNKRYQGYFARIQKLTATVYASFAWFEPEVLALPAEKLAHYYESDARLNAYRHFLDQIRLQKKHFLSEKEEGLLAAASDIFAAPENIFGILNNADLKFPTVHNDQGQTVELSHGLFGKLLESTHRAVRKEAFNALYQTYEQFQNTFATALTAHVRTHNFEAQIRNYATAKRAALAPDNLPTAVYDLLIARVNQFLPLLQRYVKLRKQVLKLDEVHMYDLYAPITAVPEKKYSFSTAKKITLEVLAIFGTEYLEIVKRAFSERWIDVCENRGKRDGAYSSGTYDTPPYILLNWQNNLESLYTLVHEMGHSVHSYLSNHRQAYQNSDYSIFVAEIASTTNENLLTQYLLENTTDTGFKAYILNHYLDSFKGTVYRQTQFAEFEDWLHIQDAAQKPLTAKELNEKYLALNQHYYGPSMQKDALIALEWTRIPHFYYNYYVYQYATGFAAASALAAKIRDEGPKDYLRFLSTGNSQYPLEAVKRAGVDMTTVEYLDAAFAIFQRRLAELEGLLRKKS
ncbi:oligoendopeptidase F [Liquorilactobacillus satsumensis]|uniref:oligoendopeptidase F n=1 Tax=Liquorilactobacillus satsumensis TaxID=259059 RepID=UPI0021C487A2|nr:oligoendopeptidase F [Liquorilactobacillus satsumensis]MCP9356486.1 oligoendopeptidase F [Liquorilactobacillus satsumensis]MCP9370375.1 oligoendopeptidase F [Liquorilactobacillus satsumensis]